MNFPSNNSKPVQAMKTGQNCTISDDVVFGREVIIYNFVNLYGCRIGDSTRIGSFVEIQKNAEVGRRVRIQSHSFICSEVTIEDDVFVGHNVNFINDRYPTVQKTTDQTWLSERTRVGRGASIGTGAIILCGVSIGEGAVIGAGSVVTHDVESHTVVAGNPARTIRLLGPDERWRGGEKAAEEPS
jgi:acetyltransferase-like isoleucine patch superfamily enzyme